MAYTSYEVDTRLAVAHRSLSGHVGENKFGRATNVDNGVDTDIWDRANPTNDQAIWLAPTQARVHAIVSSSADDDGDPGAGTVRVYGLKTWDSSETTEDVTMNGTTPVNTANSYVIINRMKVFLSGTSGPNVGVITATAAVDGTVTAQIGAGMGQTQMAIYGIPSTKNAYMTSYYGSVIKASGSASIALTLLVNEEPDTTPTAFLVKHTNGASTAGGTYFRHEFTPYFSVVEPGPAIIKLQANGDANDLDVSAGFGLILTT
jgi:hypothetical protein